MFKILTAAGLAILLGLGGLSATSSAVLAKPLDSNGGVSGTSLGSGR